MQQAENLSCVSVMFIRSVLMLLTVAMAGCAALRARAPSTAPSAFAVHAIALPDAPPEGVFTDYLAYDRAHHRVWVPAGNTGSVDVVDVSSGTVAKISGFPTTEVERHGTKRTAGPSSVTVGGTVVYIGNRGDSSVCAVDRTSLRLGACVKLASPPDGLAYVASTREVWVTSPRDHSIVILDAAKPGALSRTGSIDLDGQPEGFVVDDARGVFYTNLEDRDRTLPIDIRSRRIDSAWLPECGEGGPKGLALDRDRDILFVACAHGVRALDVGHDGARLSTIDAGDGIDNIDYVESRHELYVAAARSATLTIARLDEHGILTPIASVSTAHGARNAVATEHGTAYLTDSAAGKILVVAPVASP